MAVQMILCLETNKQAATDYIYIKDTINRFYVCNTEIKITPIYMNGKANYDSKGVINEIQKLTRDYVCGDTRVIYCVDTDTFEINVNHANELKKISQYCSANGYDMIWFCHDIEEVYIGYRISDKQKVTEATSFRRKNKILNIPEKKLSSMNKRKGFSNILLVLDNYLRRK